MKRRTSPPLPPQVIGPCKDTQGADVAEAVSAAADVARSQEIARMVNLFLAWPLPQTVCSDLCATDSAYKFPRSGTNLLTADEARQMFEHVVRKV
jgi:hypothetical protein